MTNNRLICRNERCRQTFYLDDDMLDDQLIEYDGKVSCSCCAFKFDPFEKVKESKKASDDTEIDIIVTKKESDSGTRG